MLLLPINNRCMYMAHVVVIVWGSVVEIAEFPDCVHWSVP